MTSDRADIIFSEAVKIKGANKIVGIDLNDNLQVDVGQSGIFFFVP